MTCMARVCVRGWERGGEEGGGAWKVVEDDSLSTPDNTASTAAGRVLSVGHGALDVAVTTESHRCEERQSRDDYN